MIEIKDISGRTKLYTLPGKESARRFSLMTEDSVRLVFTLAEPATLSIGDHIEVDGTPYYLTETAYPKYNPTTGGYDYDIRFDSHYYRWKNHILFYDRQGNREVSWSLTRSPEAHLGIIVSNLRSLGFTYNGKEYTAIVGSEVKAEAKPVTYDSTNIIDALTKIAEAWECEWWVVGENIYLGRLELPGEPVTLEIGKEASTMSRTKSRDLYATRLYVFGGERNIPDDYRGGEAGTVVEGIVKKRLMLPEGTPYIDVVEGQKEGEVVETVVVLDDIYPRITGVMSCVTEKEIEEKDEGTSETTRFTVYRFKDAGLPFSEKYILPGEELKIVFESGTLSGMEFTVTFNPDGLNENNPEAQVFEIVRNQDYGQWLPEEPLVPHEGDRYVLSGFDTSYVSDELVPKAEQELLTRALELKEKATADPSTYTVQVDSYQASGYDERNGLLNPEKAIDLQPGQRVELVNPGYFKAGRTSRVIGYEKKLDIPYDSPSYTIGETAAYSRLGELEQRIDNIQYKGNTYVNQGSNSSGFGAYIIKKDDTTAASDENVFSSLRTLKEINKQKLDIDGMYLRKDINDTAHGDITFDRTIGSTIYINGIEGGKGWKITSDGDIESESAVIRSDAVIGSSIGSRDFASGMFGYGWRIDSPTASGTVDNWTVRKTFKVYELVYSQVLGLNGSHIVADFNKIKTVTPLGTHRYRCEMDDMGGEMFMNLRDGDLVRIQQRDGRGGIRYLFAEVENVTSERFDLKVVEGSDEPKAGDTAFRMGNLRDGNRQGLIYLTSSDDYAPYIDVLDEVSSPQLTADNTKVRIGNLGGLTVNGRTLTGHGIYINGGIFQHSTYYLEDGSTIEQTFEVMEGKLRSEIEGVRNDISGEKGNILRNPSFASNTYYWDTKSLVHYIPVKDGWLWLPSSFYVDKETYVGMYRDGNRRVLRILNSSAGQANDLMDIPMHSNPSEDGKYTYSFSFHYRVLRAGTLRAGVSGSELYKEESLPPSGGYTLYYHTGMWDEKGDFGIAFTGEILIYGVTLRSDSAADAFLYLATGIEQSEERIKLWATKQIKDSEGVITSRYDSQLSIMADDINARVTYSEYQNGTNSLKQQLQSQIDIQADSIEAVTTDVNNLDRYVKTSGFITKSGFASLFAEEVNDRGLVTQAYVSTYVGKQLSTVAIGADQIHLEGYTTVNSGFSIDGSGNMTAKNGTFSGTITANGGQIGLFKIINNRLVWEGLDYFGDKSRTIKMGYGNNNDGLVDIAFGASTQGRFGVKAIGRAPGSAAIYGSSKQSPSYPSGDTVWAAWFDGYIYSDGYFTKSPKGNVRGGLKGAYRIDNSDTWFVFDNGIAVACTKPRSVDFNTDNF